MKFPFKRLFLTLLATTLLSLVTLAPTALPISVYGQGAVPPMPTDDDALTASASLHHPNFDDYDWYEFHKRYDSSYPVGVWLPDDETPNGPQDWRLWFLDGTSIIDSQSNNNHVHSGSESVKLWPFDVGGRQIAGIYQTVYDATPCLTYQFQIYGYSRQKEASDSLTALKIGIEQQGWDLNPDHAPAVHDDDWPSTMVWGEIKKYTNGFGLLEVTAEALNDQITVFTYADASGGNSHKIHWDTGSLEEMTPDLISEPDNPPAASISNPSANTGSTSVTISWNTSADAVGQVFYRQVSVPTTPVSPTTGLTHTVYLPLVSRAPTPWSVTTLNKTPATSHSVTINGLQAESTYEYIVASRGLSSGQCETWVSDKKEFTTAP